MESERRLSLIWFVPLIALLVSLAVAWSTYNDRGPMIEIMFDQAAGVEAGKTVVKHRDVQIGIVEDVGFTSDGSKVIARARIDKELTPFLDESAQFWVVRPQITVQGITGLDTVLSGPYIQASWDLKPGPSQRTYQALENPPLTPPDQPGRRVRLIAQDGGSMSVGAPVFYKRIEVGRIESKTLTPDGEAVVFDLFIEAPHHLRLSSGSRFWSASGIDVEIGAEGAKLRVESLVSLLQGGIAFDTVALGGTPLSDYQLFRMFPAEQEARASIFDDDYGAQIRLSISFEGSVRGLAVGAPVELRGFKVGEVVDVTADISQLGENPKVALITTVLLQPSRLGLPQGEIEDSLRFLKSLVRNGLRAKLANASLLTGALYVELVQDPEFGPAEIDETASPYPRLPSVQSDFEDLAASAEGVLNRINALPIEELLKSATGLFASLDKLVSSEDTAAVPGELSALLADTRALIGDPALRQALADISAAAGEGKVLLTSLNESGAVDELAAALASARMAAAAIQTASLAAPELMASLTEVAGTIRDLPLTDLIETATAFVSDAQKLVGSESVAALPEDLSRTLFEVENLLVDLREADAAETLAQALRDAGEAAASIKLATAEAPAALRSIRALAEKAEQLPLDDLIAGAQTVLADIDEIARSPELREVPANLNAALGSVRAIIEEMRNTDAAIRLATVLDDASQTARAITNAANELPDTLTAIETLSARISALPLDNLVAAANRLIDDLDRIATAPGAQQIPGALVASLDQVRVAVSRLQELQVPENLNTALISFDSASRSFDVLSADIQAVLPQFGVVAARADSVLSSLDVGSELNYEAVTMIREIRDAARAITVLAATVERQPNSLILGK